MSKLLLRYKWCWLLLFYSLTLLGITTAAYLRLIPTVLAQVPLYDVIGHFVLYGMAGYLAHRATHRRYVPLGRWQLPLGGLIVAACACVEESLQALSPVRSFDLKDLACNWLGIGLACWLDLKMTLRRMAILKPERHA